MSRGTVELRLGRGDHIECCWGRIDHADPRPDRDEIGHLILITPELVARLIEGPDYIYRATDPDGRALWQEHSATQHDGRTFVHTAYPIYSHGDGIPQHDGSESPPSRSQRWTWELFEAHWWDGLDSGIYVGRWPD